MVGLLGGASPCFLLCTPWGALGSISAVSRVRVRAHFPEQRLVIEPRGAFACILR